MNLSELEQRFVGEATIKSQKNHHLSAMKTVGKCLSFLGLDLPVCHVGCVRSSVTASGTQLLENEKYSPFIQISLPLCSLTFKPPLTENEAFHFH